MTGNNTTYLLRFWSAQAACAKQLSRLSRHRGWRCDGRRPTRPRNYFVPSCRPIQRGDLLGEAASRVPEGPLCSGSGEGQTGLFHMLFSVPGNGARAGVQSNEAAVGHLAMDPDRDSGDISSRGFGILIVGSALVTRVMRPAHPLSSLTLSQAHRKG